MSQRAAVKKHELGGQRARRKERLRRQKEQRHDAAVTSHLCMWHVCARLHVQMNALMWGSVQLRARVRA